MDQVDYDILRALQQNGRMTASEISKRVNLSTLKEEVNRTW